MCMPDATESAAHSVQIQLDAADTDNVTECDTGTVPESGAGVSMQATTGDTRYADDTGHSGRSY
jgi:hypothetical protein